MTVLSFGFVQPQPIPSVVIPYVLTQENDHAGKAVNRLIQQLKTKPKLLKLLGCYTKQIQDIENALFSILIGRRLDNAVGVSLDKIGKIIGQARENAADDTEYRARIRARVRANLSSGTVPEILTVFATLSVIVQMKPSYPASFLMILPTVTTVVFATMYASFLFAAKMAGVYVELDYQIVPDAISFMCEPCSAYFLADSIVGVTTITCDPGIPGTFPASGSISLDLGTANAETVTYTSRTSTAFSLASPTVSAHFARSAVALTTSTGLGFGDINDATIGGGLAGAFGD